MQVPVLAPEQLSTGISVHSGHRCPDTWRAVQPQPIDSSQKSHFPITSPKGLRHSRGPVAIRQASASPACEGRPPRCVSSQRHAHRRFRLHPSTPECAAKRSCEYPDACTSVAARRLPAHRPVAPTTPPVACDQPTTAGMSRERAGCPFSGWCRVTITGTDFDVGVRDSSAKLDNGTSGFVSG